MSNLSDRVAYLKGLAEGLGIAEEKENKIGKLLFAVIESLGDVAEAIQQLKDDHEELDEYVESIDDDLAEIEEVLFDDDHDEDDEDDDFDEDDDDDLIECECPHCDNVIFFDAEVFDIAENHVCPNCGKPLFEEPGDGDGE